MKFPARNTEAFKWHNFVCLGCDESRPTKGAKGAIGSPFRRCAVCVAAKAAKAEKVAA